MRAKKKILLPAVTGTVISCAVSAGIAWTGQPLSLTEDFVMTWIVLTSCMIIANWRRR